MWQIVARPDVSRCDPKLLANPPTIRQMALYDVVKTSTYDSFYDGYQRGLPEPPPNKLIAEEHPGALQKGVLARGATHSLGCEDERADPDFWWDWSSQVAAQNVALLLRCKFIKRMRQGAQLHS